MYTIKKIEGDREFVIYYEHWIESCLECISLLFFYIILGSAFIISSPYMILAKKMTWCELFGSFVLVMFGVFGLILTPYFLILFLFNPKIIGSGSTKIGHDKRRPDNLPEGLQTRSN
jgi:hypothetical protein